MKIVFGSNDIDIDKLINLVFKYDVCHMRLRLNLEVQVSGSSSGRMPIH